MSDAFERECLHAEFNFRSQPKEGAGIWRKHGANVSLWSVQVGEIGNLAFMARFESTAKLGETLEGLNNDPVMAAWRMKNVKANLASWVRSNQACEISI